MNYTVTVRGMDAIKGVVKDSSKKVVGSCSKCGGTVCVPITLWTTELALPTCEICGAQADENAKLPVILMR